MVQGDVRARFKERDEVGVDGMGNAQQLSSQTAVFAYSSAIKANTATYPRSNASPGADPFNHALEPQEDYDEGHRCEEDGDDHDAR